MDEEDEKTEGTAEHTPMGIAICTQCEESMRWPKHQPLPDDEKCSDCQCWNKLLDAQDALAKAMAIFQKIQFPDNE